MKTFGLVFHILLSIIYFLVVLLKAAPFVLLNAFIPWIICTLMIWSEITQDGLVYLGTSVWEGGSSELDKSTPREAIIILGWVFFLILVPLVLFLCLSNYLVF